MGWSRGALGWPGGAEGGWYGEHAVRRCRGAVTRCRWDDQAVGGQAVPRREVTWRTMGMCWVFFLGIVELVGMYMKNRKVQYALPLEVSKRLAVCC